MDDLAMRDGEEEGLVRESARGFATRFRDHAALRAGRDRMPWHEAARLPEMAALGWFGALLPPALGGLGTSIGSMAAIAEELGAALLAEPVVPLAVLGPRAVFHGDNPALQAELLPAVAEGRRFVALAWQEGFDDARDPTQVATTALTDGAGWRLYGRKRFVAGAWAADSFVVSARAQDGLRLFRLDTRAPGLDVAQEWRADGSPTALLTLDGVRLSDSDVVAGPGCAVAALQAALDEAAIVASAELMGVARAALEMTIAYMRTRVAFGRPIANFQALQHRVADLHVHQEVAGAVLEAAIRMADGEPDARELRVAAGRAKARCSEAAVEIARQSIQLHGGIGITDACDIGLCLKRATVLSAWLGNSAAHHARIAGDIREEPVVKDAAVSVDEADAPRRLAAMQAVPVAQRNWNALTDAAFRGCARQFFETNLPTHLRFKPRRLGWQQIREWYLLLSREGWLAATWPVEHGGMGLNAAKLMIYHEEMQRVGAPRLLDHGINNVGSILLACGTEEQRRTYLPRVLSGEHIWCQGYSEPNAGSDLASLRTEAQLEGDEFVVTGQKIWTTLAHEATHIYALVRTDRTRPGRDGISFLLIDLRQPGVTIRPIRNIAGHEEFCEVFLDGVRTHRSNLVGALNDGWSVSRAVLGFERLRIGAPRNAVLALQRLDRVARRVGLEADPLFHARFTLLACDVLDLAALYARSADALKAGGAPGLLETAVLKIVATHTEQRLAEALVEVLGDAGAIAGPQDLGGEEVDVLTPFLSARAVSIYGGTNEIQRNIIARRLLGA
jgi:alkylation response protein AidB-like acyl-CoA dehydrogenase